MRQIKTSILWVLLGALLPASPAVAATISFSRVAFSAAFPGAVIESWEDEAAGTIFTNGSSNDGITYTSSVGNAIVTNIYLASTPPNSLARSVDGSLDSSDLFAPGNVITLAFGSPISAFAIDVNTFDTANGFVLATTSNGEAIASIFDPFPGRTTGQFVGFSTDMPFTSISLVSGPGFTHNLDTLRYVNASPSAVPEPASSLALLGTGLAAVGMFRRFRRR